MTFRWFTMIPALALCGFVSACGGDEDPDPMVLEPTLTNVENRVFALSCSNFSGCHSGANPPKGLDLTGETHAKIVDVDSVEKPGTKLVAPGDPDASFLMDKILGKNLPEGPASEQRWTRMPPTGALEEERIDLVRRWIAAGAKND